MSEISVLISGLTHGGETIGAPGSAEADQRKVFVRGAIPGETAHVSITEDHKNFRRGTLLGIQNPSPDRVAPPCKYFERCGGCDYQYIEIGAQRQHKLRMVEGMLKRQGGVEPRQGVQLLGQDLPAYGYRSRVTLHLALSEGPRPAALGFFREGSGEVVDLSECLLAQASINQALSAVRKVLSRIEDSFAALVIESLHGEIFVAAKLREDAFERVDLEGSEAVRILRDLFLNVCVLDHERPILVQYRGKEEEPASRSVPTGRFSQINEAGNRELLSKVCELVRHPEVTDLYAGAGNFSIPLALAGKNVQAVELDPELVEYGKRLRFEAGIPESRLIFTERSCEQFVKSAALKRSVLLDPPRSGAEAVAKALKPKISQQVIYVSCGLPTLCRDAKILSASGYALEAVWMVDMFAQTHHVETISLFEAR